MEDYDGTPVNDISDETEETEETEFPWNKVMAALALGASSAGVTAYVIKRKAKKAAQAATTPVEVVEGEIVNPVTKAQPSS